MGVCKQTIVFVFYVLVCYFVLLDIHLSKSYLNKIFVSGSVYIGVIMQISSLYHYP